MPSSSGICSRAAPDPAARARSSRPPSLPDSASPTTTTSSNDRRSATRNDRAGPLIVGDDDAQPRASHRRPAAARALGRRRSAIDRQADFDGRASPGADRIDSDAASPYWQASRRSTFRRPTPAARPARSRRSPSRRAGVVHDERRARARSPDIASSSVARTVTSPAGLLRRDAVLDRVLDERLQHERRHADASRSRGGTSMRTRSRCSNRARSMSRYDSIDLELAAERREFAFGSQHAAQQRRQPHQRLERARRRRLNQVADRRQRVEEKVRIDLRAQRPQLGFGRELADLLLAESRARSARA